MSEPLLEAQQLSHAYGQYLALAPTDLSLNAGEIVVLTGPNGAGKTTLLLCLSGLQYPSSGRIRVDGFDLYRQEVDAKASLAFVPDVPRFYTELTAWEHLHFIALAHGAGSEFERNGEILLKELGLWEARHLFPHHFSRGMRLKLGLAMALIRPFKVLLLDEPTSALDPDGVELVRRRLLDLRRDGAAILLSSHNPAFARELGDRVIAMRAGHLQAVEPGPET